MSRFSNCQIFVPVFWIDFVNIIGGMIFMIDNNKYTFSQIVEMTEIKHKSEVDSLVKKLIRSD